MKSKKKGRSLEQQQQITIERIAARMKDLRLKKGFKSSEKFAINNEIDRAQYGRYERGEIDLQISSLVKILAALEVSMSEFFSEGFED